ncbi:hypothetical protein AB0A77_09485 [Streptomyces varsoviensis]|uniref:hypothetical protein n=1 Tax=Streptomyces varsoviensis TaxID=67373 RepID=UPI0033D85C24
MFAADALPQQIGLAVLLAAIVFLVVGLVRNARRGTMSPLPWASPSQAGETPPAERSPTSATPADPAVPADPAQSTPSAASAAPPPRESVELTPAEREAFAGLVRQWKTPFQR